MFLGVVVFDVPCDGCLSWDEFDDTDIIFFLACCADEVYVNPFGYKNVFFLMSYLNRHPGTEEESSIGEAILLAGETITNNKGRVVVLSDFINTKGLKEAK